MSSREDKRNGSGDEKDSKLRSREDQETLENEKQMQLTRIVKNDEFNTLDLRTNLTTEDTELQSSSSNRMMKRWLDGLSK